MAELTLDPMPAAGRANERYARAVSAWQEVAEALADERDLAPLLDLIARKTCELVGVPRCSAYLRDGTTGLFRGQLAVRTDDDGTWTTATVERIRRLTAGVDADRFTQEIIARRAPVVIDNTQYDPRPVRAAMREWNIKSMLGVPMIARDEIVGLLFLDDQGEFHRFTPEDQELASAFCHLAGVAILQARRAGELRANAATIARQNQVLRQVVAAEARISDLALQGGSLVDILDTLAEVLDRPCVLHDAGFRRLGAGIPHERAMLPRLLDPDVRAHPAVARAIAEALPSKPGPLPPFPAAGVHHRHILAAISVRGEVWGYLAVPETGSRFGPLDIVAVRHAAAIIALEVGAQRAAAPAPGDGRGSVVREVLDTRTPHEAVLRRAEFRGLRLQEPHVVCLLAAGADAGELPPAAELEHLAARAGAGDAWVSELEPGRIAMLIPLDPQRGPKAAVTEARALVERLCTQLPAPSGVVAGLSGVCREPADYARGFDEASQTLRCALRFAPSSDLANVLTADDLGPARLVVATTGRDEGERFVRGALGPLLESRDSRTADLLVTLSGFFRCGRGIRDSAAALGVHENTIRYRLARIAELTGLDVATDPDDQLEAQIALLILRLDGRLPAEALAVPDPAADTMAA